MSKAIMISIQPKWCELIASGTKTLEVRKTRPKIEPPFKCYIYCTKPRMSLVDVIYDGQEIYGSVYNGVPAFIKTYKDVNAGMWIFGKWGKVIGEFVCDTFVIDKTFGHDKLFNAAACMSETDAATYSLNSPMYGWHISNLKIYDTPKGLGEFWKPCPYGDVSCYLCDKSGHTPDMTIDCFNNMTRPPQSWCYVEEGEE